MAQSNGNRVAKRSHVLFFPRCPTCLQCGPLNKPKSRGVFGARVVGARAVIAALTTILLAGSPVVAGRLPPANTGHFYVSSFESDEVVVYDGSGDVLRRFSDPEVDGPRGIVIGPQGRIFVAAQNSDAIVVFDADERYIATYTHPELDGPTGLALGPGAVLYACSYENHRIVAFGPDGEMVGSFTAGALRNPTCIVVSGGSIHVAGAARPWIFRFDADGTPHRPIIVDGLVSPAGMAMARGMLYVADERTGRILILDGDGTVEGEVAHRHLHGPRGMAFDDRGHLFVSSGYGHLIVEFDRSGGYLRTIGGGKLGFPDGVAFSAMRVGDVDDDGHVGLEDFGRVIARWGDCPSEPTACPSDVNHSGSVDLSDLFTLLANWD